MGGRLWSSCRRRHGRAKARGAASRVRCCRGGVRALTVTRGIQAVPSRTRVTRERRPGAVSRSPRARSRAEWPRSGGTVRGPRRRDARRTPNGRVLYLPRATGRGWTANGEAQRGFRDALRDWSARRAGDGRDPDGRSPRPTKSYIVTDPGGAREAIAWRCCLGYRMGTRSTTSRCIGSSSANHR